MVFGCFGSVQTRKSISLDIFSGMAKPLKDRFFNFVDKSFEYLHTPFEDFSKLTNMSTATPVTSVPRLYREDF